MRHLIVCLCLSASAVVLGAAAPKPKVVQTLAIAGFEPAPMPNPDMGLTEATPAARTHLGPAVFAASHKQYRGDGFTADSSEQVAQERNFKPGGGLALKMPLQ